MRTRANRISFLSLPLGLLLVAGLASTALAETHSLRWYHRHHMTPPGDSEQAPAADTQPAPADNTASSGPTIAQRTLIYDAPAGTGSGVLLGGTAVTINRCVQGWCLITKPAVGWIFETDINK